MSAILLLPGFISLFLVVRGRIETAFLSVYLPSLLLLPEEYSIRIPHLPPISAAEFALIPVGIAALLRFVKSGSFRLMDALVPLFFFSFTLSEILHEPVLNDGIFFAITYFVSIVLAYVVGRQLIEPDLRLAAVRRIVILMLLPGPICVYQWMNRNIYGIVGNRFLNLPMEEYVAMRGGHGRAGGAFNNGEIDGIALGMTFALDAWLVFLNKRKIGGDPGNLLSKLEKYHVPALLLVFYLFLTQERGPLIGLAIVLLILQIPKFKKTKLVTGFVAVLLIVGALGAKQHFAKYADIPDYEYGSVSEEARSVFYRQQMNKLYQLIAEMGGWTGWSNGRVPEIPGLKSIDNEFLLVHLVQGELGYFLFLLITAESVRTAIARLWSLQTFEDRAFATSVLAALACLWITLYTVFMGQQLPQFAFLLIGWGQSIVPGRTSTAPLAATESQSKFAFRRVFG
jgi:hypothetical protein